MVRVEQAFEVISSSLSDEKGGIRGVVLLNDFHRFSEDVDRRAGEYNDKGIVMEVVDRGIGADLGIAHDYFCCCRQQVEVVHQ